MLEFHVCEVEHLPLIIQDNKWICDASFDWSPLPLFVDIVIMLMNEAFLLLFLDTASDQKLDGGKAWEGGYIEFLHLVITSTYVLLCPVVELVLSM